jgi:CubicO group peptidase (beta-lactamase class C family)
MRRTTIDPARLLIAAVGLVMLGAGVSPAVAAAGAGLDGHWEGAIELPGQPLEIDLDFAREGEGWNGDISIPAQGAQDLPLVDVRATGVDVSFVIQGIPGEPTFDGALSEDGESLDGSFTQGGQTFPFHLTRGIDRATEAAEALSGIGEVIEAALEDWKAPGLGLSVVVDGTPVLAEGYGLRDVERALPVTPQTLFAIGSATKAFTTFLMGTLADEGRLDWDEPVARYLPGFELYDEYATVHVTPRDMATHRSGLPRHDLAWYNDESITRAEVVRRLRHLPPNKELREAWQYNNFMYATAGYLVEQISGKSWEDNVRERILEPLGMTRSNLSVADSQADDNAAQPYLEEDDVVRKIPFRPIGVMAPAGAINSSVEDMARWVALQTGDGRSNGRQLIASGTLHEMHTPQVAIPVLPDKPEHSPAGYALGWFTETYRGHYRVHHGGNIDGFSALVSLFPTERVGIVVLVNKNASPLPHLVTLTVADRVFGLDPAGWIDKAAVERDRAKAFVEQGEQNKDLFRVEDTHPSRELAAFAGAYEQPGYGIVEIRTTDDGLVMEHNDMVLPLRHWHYDVFNVEAEEDEVIPEDLRVSFLADERGRISRIAVPFEPYVDPIVFTRLPDRKLADPAYLARLAGEYELPNQPVTIDLQGNTLVLRIAGQPAYDLVPSGTDEFELEGIAAGISVKFTVPESGPATEATFVQPNGVFPARRKRES